MSPGRENSAESTLHLPRILCFHGGGTNSRIFRTQCRSIEAEMKSYFRFVYAEAPFSSEAGPDVLAVYKSYGPFKRWFRWKPEQPEISSQEAIRGICDSLQEAIYADNLKGATGEWVGLLGFSQGAKLAASLLLQQQAQTERVASRQHATFEEQNLRFRFAVLFAGRAPLVAFDQDMEHLPGLVNPSELTVKPDYKFTEREDCPLKLRIPTIHVHGLLDPGLAWHRQLLENHCEHGTAKVMSWNGEHRVPVKSKDVLPIVYEIFDMAEQVGALQ